MAKGIYTGLSQATIQAISDAAAACIIAGTVRGVSYTIAGRSFSFPSIESCNNAIEECNYALGRLTGQISSSVRVNFNVKY